MPLEALEISAKMIALKTILITICGICLSWIALITAGPLVLSSIIDSYSNGNLVASNITITPRLNIKIGRLEYASRLSNNASKNQALFRSVELIWSMSNNKPFIEITGNSSLINKTHKTDSLKLYTPAFANTNFDKIFLNVEINNLSVVGMANSRSVNLAGFYEKDLKQFSDLTFDISSLEVDVFEQWFVNSTSGVVDKINLNMPLKMQKISIETTSSEAFNRAHNIFISSLNNDFIFEDGGVDFFVSLSDLEIGNENFIAKEVISQGTFLKERLFKDVNIEFEQISINEAATKFPSASVILLNPSANTFSIGVSGFSNKFDLVNSGEFIAQIPESTFEVDFFLDGANPDLNSNLNISLNFGEQLEIEGIGDILLTFDGSIRPHDCLIFLCQIKALFVDYKIYINEDWFSGNASCTLSPCLIRSLPHNLVISNTAKIFTTLGQAKIFNPMILSYLYGLALSGEKFELGHKIRIN